MVTREELSLLILDEFIGRENALIAEYSDACAFFSAVSRGSGSRPARRGSGRTPGVIMAELEKLTGIPNMTRLQKRAFQFAARDPKVEVWVEGIDSTKQGVSHQTLYSMQRRGWATLMFDLTARPYRRLISAQLTPAGCEILANMEAKSWRRQRRNEIRAERKLAQTKDRSNPAG